MRRNTYTFRSPWGFAGRAADMPDREVIPNAAVSRPPQPKRNGIAFAYFCAQETNMASVPLRYVRAHDIGHGPAAFGAMVCDPDGQPIGRLEGFMIDTESQTVRYFVVDRLRGRRLERRMIPFTPAQLDLEHHVVRLIEQPRAA
jgi:hypothetical protein